MNNIVDASRVRLQRELRWDQLEIQRLQLLTKIGALSSVETDPRIVELENRVAGLTAQLDARKEGQS
jgi:hypothetical protein